MWEQFLQERDAQSDRFALLSVAVDAVPERARPFAAGLAFPTAVDSSGLLGRLFDFDVVPNGLFLDEQGVIRFLHIGGFDVRRPEIAQQVEALIGADFEAGEAPAHAAQESFEIETLRAELAGEPENEALHFALGDALLREGRPAEAEAAFRRANELDPSDWAAAFGLGSAQRQQGRTDEALHWWRQALERDPKNFTIRKQIWHVEHPEKFYPEIDFDWQQEQLKREGYTP